jgi:hypothetical protein
MRALDLNNEGVKLQFQQSPLLKHQLAEVLLSFKEMVYFEDLIFNSK